MESEEQISEDGELVKSPTKHSPIQLSKDPSTFPSVSEDEDAEDTADSLDIKPPQAAVAHHHKTGSRGAAKRERDKHHKDSLREHAHPSIKSEATSISHRKSHHRSHREHREERFREKRHHRQRHEGLREHDFPRAKVKEKSGGERMLEDLRERLLDKRRAGGKHERRERERREEEEATMAAAMRETPREKAERVEREMRRERLLEADREMVRQKEVYRRELEARRERHYLEKEKERTLREIQKRRERSRSQERKKRRLEEGEEEDDEMEGKDKEDAQDAEEKKDNAEEGSLASQLVVVSSESEMDEADPETEGKQQDDGASPGEEGEDEEEAEEEEEDDDDDEEEEEESSSSSDTEDDDRDTDVSGPRSDEEQHFHSHVRSPSRSVSRERSGDNSPLAVARKDRHGPEEEEEEEEEEEDMVKKQGPPSPPRPQDALLSEKQALLPPYLPAVQGCRSVDEFQCLNRIEEGTYGVVYRAKDLRTQEVVALKRLKMEKEKEGFPITSLREINTLLKAQHANIVTVREIVVGSNMDKIYIVMDYVEHDLKSLMETMKSKKQVFIPGEVKCLMQQLLRAVAHLHDNWILHRDLKTSNLLLSHKGILKVGDFGLAREYGSPLKHYTPVVVTLWYRAPELLLCSKEYSTPIDMWSVGCIFGEFITMEALFPGKSEVDQLNRIFKDLGTPNERVWPGYDRLPAVQRMNFSAYPVNQLRQRFGSTMITDTGMELMNRFLTYDPSQRVTAEEALKHEYFREAPLPIDPAMFPTWPAKSELGHRKAAAASPKPPPGGAEYKQLGDTDEDMGSMGFHMGVVEKGRVALGPGFSLKF